MIGTVDLCGSVGVASGWGGGQGRQVRRAVENRFGLTTVPAENGGKLVLEDERAREYAGRSIKSVKHLVGTLELTLPGEFDGS